MGAVGQDRGRPARAGPAAAGAHGRIRPAGHRVLPGHDPHALPGPRGRPGPHPDRTGVRAAGVGRRGRTLGPGRGRRPGRAGTGRAGPGVRGRRRGRLGGRLRRDRRAPGGPAHLRLRPAGPRRPPPARPDRGRARRRPVPPRPGRDRRPPGPGRRRRRTARAHLQRPRPHLARRGRPGRPAVGGHRHAGRPHRGLRPPHTGRTGRPPRRPTRHPQHRPQHQQRRPRHRPQRRPFGHPEHPGRPGRDGRDAAGPRPVGPRPAGRRPRRPG